METVGHRKLKAWLRASELSGTQLAQLANLAPMQIYHLTRGRRRASLEVAIRLDDATRGAIPCRAWIEPAH